jgi:L-iditol 2-dehydrogenase
MVEQLLAVLQNRELTLTGAFRYANTYPTAIGLVAAGRVDLDAIVSGHYALDEAEQALQAGKNDPQSVKAVVVPSQAGDGATS